MYRNAVFNLLVYRKDPFTTIKFRRSSDLVWSHQRFSCENGSFFYHNVYIKESVHVGFVQIHNVQGLHCTFLSRYLYDDVKEYAVK